MYILAVIYLIALPFTLFFTKKVLEAIPNASGVHPLALFLSVWLVLPMFPLYLIVKKLF